MLRHVMLCYVMLCHKYKHVDFKIRSRPSVCSVGNIGTTFRELVLCPSSGLGGGGGATHLGSLCQDILNLLALILAIRLSQLETI
jgi:hypothetical protein